MTPLRILLVGLLVVLVLIHLAKLVIENPESLQISFCPNILLVCLTGQNRVAEEQCKTLCLNQGYPHFRTDAESEFSCVCSTRHMDQPLDLSNLGSVIPQLVQLSLPTEEDTQTVLQVPPPLDPDCVKLCKDKGHSHYLVSENGSVKEDESGNFGRVYCCKCTTSLSTSTSRPRVLSQ